MVDFGKYLNNNPYETETKSMSNFDFSDADKQHERGPIPADSMVLLEMNLRQPKPELTGSDPWLRMSNDGMCEMLDCEFTVVAGSFTGKRIWKMYVMDGGQEKHKIARDRSRETIRAILDSARNIAPDDHSAQAKAARRISSFEDFIGMRFAALIGVDKPKVGDSFVNNNIKRVITPDDENYQAIMNGGEYISDTPIPEIPDGAPAQAQTTQWGKPQTKTTAHQGNLMNQGAKPQTANKWGTKPAENQAAPQAQNATPAKSARPAWTKGNGAAKAEGNEQQVKTLEQQSAEADPGPAFPSEATGMDDVPF